MIMASGNGGNDPTRPQPPLPPRLEAHPQDLSTLLQNVEEDMGGEVEESTQERENKACSLVKEAVLHQILQHTLTVHATEIEEGVIVLAEEQLDALQALLETGAAGEDRPPPPRNFPPPVPTPTEEEIDENTTRGHPNAPYSPTSTANSHRRKRKLAMHHKEFIGEDRGDTDDEHWGRYASSSSSQDGAPPDEEPQERGEEEEINGTTGRTGEMESDHEEDTNLDDELRQRLVEGRVLPNPEASAAAAMGECSNVELEHYMAGIQRQLSAHIRWLRTNRAFWGSVQQSLVHELQVALNGGAILTRSPYTVTYWGDYRKPTVGRQWHTKQG